MFDNIMLRVIVFQLCFHYLLLLCSCRKSGLYIDNGVDQTIVQRFMTKQEKREVEHEILNLLGLENRPRPVANSKTLGSSAPKFLLDVYKSVLENSGSSLSRTTRSEFFLSGRDLHAIDESDVIMTFTSNNKHVSSVRHERGKRLWFDVSEIPIGETVVDAELRLYQNSNYSMDPGENFTITIYQLLMEDGEKELEFIDAVNTSRNHDGWLIFNMTGPLTSWVAFPRTNRGLYLSVQPQGAVHEMRPEDIGVVSASLEGEEEKQPFMVAFMKATSQKRARRTREIRRRKKAENSESPYSRNPLDPSPFWSTRSCQIQTLYVSFRDLGWQDWIIAPDGYGAFYCSGECNFPLNAHMNATNHAIVQTLVHLMYPYDVPKPYCAPTKLTPISVLYFLDDSNVILKKYKNMVVKSCGCH